MEETGGFKLEVLGNAYRKEINKIRRVNQPAFFVEISTGSA